MTTNRDAYKPEYLIMGIALSGVYAEANSSYGDGFCSISIPDTRLECYFGNLLEGGTVIDKRTVNTDKLISGVISGPMLNLSLKPGTVSRFGTFPRQEEKAPDDLSTLRSHDYIALDVYLTFWRRLGAKIGQRKGNEVVWEDGTVEEIRSEEKRWLGLSLD